MNLKHFGLVPIAVAFFVTMAGLATPTFGQSHWMSATASAQDAQTTAWDVQGAKAIAEVIGQVRTRESQAYDQAGSNIEQRPGGTNERKWPDIKDPGLDLGDFPNSAFTIPAGTWQLELAPFSILGEDEFNQPQYFTQFLLRYGLTDDVEFRILGDGFTWLYTEPQTTGFSPITLDLKIHLWDEKREWFLPASSLEAFITTDWGSDAFSSGYQPTINLNFDLPFGDTWNLEWTVGYGEVLATLFRSRSNNGQPIEENVNQVSFQWSVSKELTDDFDVFVTGQTVESVPGQSAGTGLGFGGSWRWSERLMYYGLLGWGVTDDAPKIGAQLGLGIALGHARSD